MNWISVKERLPDNMYPVLATVENEYGRCACSDIRWNAERGFWEHCGEAIYDYWEELPKGDTVTHWMPYPEPAKD